MFYTIQRVNLFEFDQLISSGDISSLFITYNIEYNKYIFIVNGNKHIIFGLLLFVYILFRNASCDIKLDVYVSIAISKAISLQMDYLLTLEGIIRPVLSASAPIWFIRYIYV